MVLLQTEKSGILKELWELDEILYRQNVCNLFRKKAVVISGECTIAESFEIMKENDTDYVLVRDQNGNLQGIFTSRDVVKKISPKRMHQDLYQPVSDYMSTGLVSLKCTDTVKTAIQTLYCNSFEHLPIIDSSNGRIKGVVTLKDIALFLTEYFPEMVNNYIPGQRMSADRVEGA